MATVRGVGVNFGISSSLAGVTGVFQTLDHTYRSDAEIVQDGSGESVAKVYYNASQEASFTYVATGTNGVANATVTVPTIGSLLVVTDAGYTAIAATTWLVDEVSVAKSNTGAARVTCKLTKYPAITS